MAKALADGFVPLYRFWQPRYWWMWASVGIMRLLTLLPHRAQMACGRFLGRLGARTIHGRRRIADANLRICFPELNDTERADLVRQHFESLGMGLFELAQSWWATDEQCERLVETLGLDHLLDAQRSGRGVIVLSGHFAATELTARAITPGVGPGTGVYRPARNKLADQFLRRGRMRSATLGLIQKQDIRRMIRLLRDGGTIWYAADQSYARKYHELVPFFGEPAMTNAALTHIARISKAIVIPYFPRRNDDYSGYVGTFLPPLENFPTDDPAADATRVNALLEQYIRLAPEQYLWIHRRFKGRPAGHPDPYAPNAVV